MKMIRKPGFTLIEFLVLIVITGILFTAVILSIHNVKTKARDSRRRADLRTIKSVVENFKFTNRYYPRTCLAPSPCDPISNPHVWFSDATSVGSGFTNYRLNVINNINVPGLTWENYEFGRFYVPEVTPNYIRTLPIDPLYNPPPDNLAVGYFYSSNGRDFKALANHSVETMTDIPPADTFYDHPTGSRGNTFTVWSEGGKDW